MSAPPPEAFKKLDESVQVKFWQDAKDKAGKVRLEDLYISAFIQARIEQDIASNGGEYMPLRVYATRGFDVKRIAERLKDIEEDEVLSTCYRV